MTPLRFKTYVLFFFVILGISCAKKNKKIPIISKDIALHQKKIDSLHFTNELNQRFLISSVKGEVHIVNFFFTSCNTICPLMEVPLNALAKKYADVKFLSFTIDPDKDTIAVLKEYHELHKQTNQTLLRGSKKDLANIAKYYLNSIDTDDIENLYHTSYIALLDKEMNIRGLFDSLDPEDMAFLEKDIIILLKN